MVRGDLELGHPIREVVLFLDFDGVVHRDGSTDDDLFDAACLQLLAAVLRAHPLVALVVSSSWREVHPLVELRRLLQAEVGNRVIGCTPDRVDVKQLPGELWSFARHGQCWAWMHWNRPVGTPWLALDDQEWRFAKGSPHLVLVNSLTGLDATVAAELDRRLSQLEMVDAEGQLDD